MSEVADIVNKICTKCGDEKIENEDNFRIRKNTGKYISRCLVCLKEDNSKYHKEYDKRMKENPPEREFPEEKECTQCYVVKKLNEENYNFHKIRREFASACKACVNKQSTERYDDKLKKQGKIKKAVIKIPKNATHKVCTGCKRVKNIKNDYYFKKADNRYDSKCKICVCKRAKVSLNKPKNKAKKAQTNKAYKKIIQIKLKFFVRNGLRSQELELERLFLGQYELL
jgi:hypothetical protein